MTFDPDSTLISKVNAQVDKPIVTWSTIGSVLGMAIAGFIFITEIQGNVRDNTALIVQGKAKDAANHYVAMEAIDHETEMRTITARNVSDQVEEIKENLKDLADQVNDDSKETQRLLRELIQKD